MLQIPFTKEPSVEVGRSRARGPGNGTMVGEPLPHHSDLMLLLLVGSTRKMPQLPDFTSGRRWVLYR